MDGNCRPHRANLVEDFLFEEGIVRMEWPACFPDMNPIEHVWDALERRVAGHQPPPKLSKNWKELFWKSGTEYLKSELIASLTPCLKVAGQDIPGGPLVLFRAAFPCPHLD
ncbi:transposable element Tcb2 transposase [Trichonephila clavipes]|nr:transposable element Tcb2 transposase [Trichonephila clavipes]